MDHLVSGRRTHGGSVAAPLASHVATKLAGFTDPWDVVLDPDLTSGEKRDILSDWASDARVVAGRPGLRMNTAGAIASWDDIMEGLRLIDAGIASAPRSRPSRVRRARFSGARMAWRKAT